MSSMTPGEITYAQLTTYLGRLGFEQSAASEKSQAFVHLDSGTTLVLARPAPAKPVRPADLLSVLVRLEYEGLASEAELKEIRHGKLPKAS